MRLDSFLFEGSYTSSRTEAKNFITSGAVTVNGVVVTKPSFDVGMQDVIAVDTSTKKYVSRGGVKLEAALTEFGVIVQNKLAIDIGASSGGFTDCLLQNGAAHVVCVDSGTNQLVPCLRVNERVTVLENYNARYLSAKDIAYVPNLAVMDVSFISATLIIPAIYNVLSDAADFICLIKPQFEVGRGGLSKGGIVKDDRLRSSAAEKVIAFSESIGFKFISKITSPIRGGDGNIEYLAHFRKVEEK